MTLCIRPEISGSGGRPGQRTIFHHFIQVSWEAGQAPTGFCAAARGSTSAGSAGPRTATGAGRATATTTSASAWPSSQVGSSGKRKNKAVPANDYKQPIQGKALALSTHKRDGASVFP